ncbi:MAG: hypothetical protein IPL07_12810 [Acidimicrobiaceae bacterium]|nr:hypothetical protein [Acidimicrobiaceae bacterium]
MSVLVVDVGTSGLRAAVVRPDGEVSALHYRAFPPATPFPGLVEFDAVGMAAAVLEVARASLAEGGPVLAVGITAQRASTIVWDRATGEPVGPGLGWQDLRTVFDCITAKADHGLQLAPNQSATKVAWLLNTYDPGRERDLCFGTVDTWVAWVLSEGQVHVTDHSNAAVTGLLRPDATGWSTSACSALGVPAAMLPALVDTSSVFGVASALAGSPPLAALVGDQQGSLVGQSCVRPGQAKITFGSGGMLDLCTDAAAPSTGNRTSEGIFPIVAWSRNGVAARGAWKPSCSRRAPTSSGWCTTSASSTTRHRATTLPRSATPPRGWSTYPRSWAWALLTGTTALAVPCWGSPAAAAGRRSLARCWRESPIAAPTWWRPHRQARATTYPCCASTVA